MASFSFPRAVVGLPRHPCRGFPKGLCFWGFLLLLLNWCGPVAQSQLATNPPAPASFEEIRQKAEAGEPVFQRFIANCYLTGEKVNADPAEAARWFRLAAEKNDALAQFALGLMYDEGKGVPSDMAEAVRWFRKAADQGLAEAQLNLGVCYAKGEGIMPDQAEAAKWYRKAAEQGDVQGQSRLGLACLEGIGVEKNDSEAVKWLRRAAYQNDPVAQFFLGMLYRDGKGVGREPVEAVKWYRRAAEQGYAEAQYWLGHVLLQGDGISPDGTNAVQWFQKAAAQGNPRAQFQMGQSYLTGEGALPVDPIEAVKWFRKAAEQGDPNAQLQLAVAYEKGRGVEIDRDVSIKWMRQAAAQGHAGAQKLLVTMGQGGSLTNALASNSVQTAELTNVLKTVMPAPAVTLTAAVKTAAADLGKPGASSGRGGDLLGRHLDMALLLAACTAAATMVITLVGVFMLASFKHRISSLEQEIKETKYELGKANVTLSTMLHYVESRALADKRSEKTQIAPPAPTQIPAAASESISFKAHRTRGNA